MTVKVHLASENVSKYYSSVHHKQILSKIGTRHTRGGVRSKCRLVEDEMKVKRARWSGRSTRHAPASLRGFFIRCYNFIAASRPTRDVQGRNYLFSDDNF